MPLVYRDGGTSTLQASINATVTTITPASIATFPNPTRGDFSANNNEYFYITVEKGTGESEVLKVTDVHVNTGVFTVSRGYGTGIANSFTAGDTLQLRMGSAILGDHVANTYLTKNYDDNANTVSNTYLKTIGFASNTYAASNTYVNATFATKAYAASNAYVNGFAGGTIVSNTYLSATYPSNTYLKGIGFTSNAYAASNTYVNAQIGALVGNTASNTAVNKRLEVANATALYATKAYAASNAYVNGFAGGTIVSNTYLNANFYNNSSAVSNTYLAANYLKLSGGNTSGGVEIRGLVEANTSGIPLSINSTDSNAAKIRFEDAGTTRSFIHATSTIVAGFYDESSNFELTVGNDGNASLRGTLTESASDDRLKNKIENIQDALSKVQSLDGFKYTWNDNSPEDFDKQEERIGVSAQAVQAILPQIVKSAPFDTNPDTGESLTGNDYLTVQYEYLVPLLIEAIKELAAKVEELENK